MATMIPENVEIFTTEGEKQFYRFLESVAKPDSQYIAWYTPDVKGKRSTEPPNKQVQNEKHS